MATEIIARYLAFWDARFRANEDPVNPDDPALQEYATGRQLVNVRTETERNQIEGLAFRLPVDTVGRRDARLVSVAGDIAQIQDCAVNDGVLYRVSTGEVVDDSVVTRSIAAVMQRVEGEWRLEAATVVQEWEGVAGCAIG